MRVVTVKTSSYGPSGTVLTHGSAWRLAFPVKGCVAKPDDAETVQLIQREIDTTSGPTKERLLDEMARQGTFPVKLETVVKVEPSAEIALSFTEPVEVVQGPVVEPVAVPTVLEQPEPPRHIHGRKNRGK